MKEGFMDTLEWVKYQLNLGAGAAKQSTQDTKKKIKEEL